MEYLTDEDLATNSRATRELPMSRLMYDVPT